MDIKRPGLTLATQRLLSGKKVFLNIG